MSARDTQFKNFATLLFNDTEDMFNNHYLHVDNCEYEKAEDTKNGIIAYIAQCAYDLVQHALDYAFTHTTEDVISAIPDLTELPEVSK